MQGWKKIKINGIAKIEKCVAEFNIMERYISFEEQINKQKNAYYESLRESSVGWHESQNSYFSFIENFITTLLFCYKELDKRFAVVNAKKVTKKQRVEAALAAMVKEGQVEKIGTGRATKYIKAE